MEASRQFEQLALFPGHTPTDEIPTARKWASRAARGARVHYISPHDNYRMPGAHGLSVSIPGKKKDQPRKTVSQIHWYPTSVDPEASGEIGLVQTDSNYERRGLASGLFHIARSLGAENADIAHIQHGRVQTPKGRQWSRKVGEP